MKLPIKLRTRLFLSISALITVALIGLLLGLFSVTQMTRGQSQLIQHGFSAVQICQKLRQHLGDQLMLMIDEQPDPQAMENIHQQFRASIAQGLENHPDERFASGLQEAARLYEDMLRIAEQAAPNGETPHDLAEQESFTRAYERVRDHLRNEQELAVASVIEAEQRAGERSTLVAVLLGLIGLAVLLIGVLTAHGIARRFGAPIDLLARAADQVGQGNYDVVLPVSPVTELSVLSRRFGLMTEALREYRSTNIHQLRRSEGRLQAVLDSIDDGLVILDNQGCVEHANPVAMRQLSWQVDPHGRTLAELLPNAPLEQALQRVLSGALLEEPPQDLAIDSAGEPRLLAWAMTPVQLRDNASVGAVLVLHDVTKQRSFERARNEFILRASHELRTPITGIHMAFSLLRERLALPAAGRERELVRTVDEEMRRLVQLIDDLLNFSRYQSGVQTLKRAPCEVPSLLTQACEAFRERAEEQAINLDIEAHGPLPRLNLDHSQLQRVLHNLIDNALRHSERQGSVQLQARRAGEQVIISVTDHGEGIPFSQQARIFEPFVQAGRRKGGAGLGLALAREIVQLHGGRLEVFSQPGQGAQFYLSLPV